MRQEEFLQGFQDALTGEVSESVIQSNLAYYKNYIYEEVRKGRSQEEVIASLGNPRLLAKTIIDTSRESAYSDNGYYDNNKTYDSYNSFHGWEDAEEKHRHIDIKNLKLPSWLKAILSVLVIAVVIGLVFCVISYLAPVILVVAGIAIVVRIIRKIGNEGF